MNDELFFKSMGFKLGLLLILMFLITACSSVEYLHTGNEIQSSSIKAVLSHCVDAPVGYVGSTNLSLSKAYLDTMESLDVCKGISKEVIDYLDHKEN